MGVNLANFAFLWHIPMHVYMCLCLWTFYFHSSLISHLSPRTSHLSKTCSFLLKNSIGNQDLHNRCACYTQGSVNIQHPSWRGKQISVFDTHTYIHISVLSINASIHNNPCLYPVNNSYTETWTLNWYPGVIPDSFLYASVTFMTTMGQMPDSSHCHAYR